MIDRNVNLVGMIFGRLTVIRKLDKDEFSNHGIKSKGTHYLCKCSCSFEKYKAVSGHNLRNGKTISCGCWRKESIVINNKRYNEYDLSGEFGIGYDRMGKGEFYFDIDDYNLIKEHCWCFQGSGYVTGKTPGTGKYILLHRLVMGFPELDIDHVNRNRNDNRKENLRVSSKKENARNRTVPSNTSTGITGVCLNTEGTKWRSYISFGGKQYSLKSHVNFEDAVIARLKGELKYFGPDFSPQRHLFAEYGITDEPEQ